MLFSEFMLSKSVSKRLAYLGVFTAFSLVSNLFLEFKFFDVQFSLSILISCFIGIALGPVSGFGCCVLGDFLGYILNSNGYPYMFWVGLSTGLFAFISGFVFFVNKNKSTKAIIIKLIVISLITFLLCTIGINSLGFYFYNKTMGFSTAVLSYVEGFTGNEKVTFFYYVLYRLVFKGQIWNSVANYILMIIVIPILMNKLTFLFGIRKEKTI